jgi:pyridoxamine 5'-phosphate oxidase-like protein
LTVFRWADFEREAPDLAAQGGELIGRFGFVLAGTIRRDGTPRISPVEARVVEGHLMLIMIRGTHKARDVLRDSRLVLNTPVFDPADPGCEFKLRGRAVAVEDRSLLEATTNATEAASGWRPPADWHFFSIEVDDVALMEWDRGELTMTRWVRERGLERVTRPAPLLDEPGR